MNLRFYIKSFYHANQREIQFIFLFILFFLCGQSLYYWSKNYTSKVFVHRLNAGVSAYLINFINPDERAKVFKNEIRSGPLRMIIEEGCEGTEGIILVVSALLAFKMSAIFKTIGIILGTLILYISNLARIVALYYSIKYKPEFFDVLHMYIGQSFYIFVGSVFFIFWIQMGEKSIEEKVRK